MQYVWDMQTNPNTLIYDYYLNVFKPSLDKYIEKYS